MKSQKKWFIATLVMVSVTFITIWVIYSADKVRFNIEFFSWAFKEFNTFDTSDIKKQIILSRKQILNSDVVSDSEACSDWPLTIFEDSSRSCYNNTTFLTEAPISWNDWIMDSWDNNDYKCSYFSDSNASKLDLWASKKCDNDDEYRLEIKGLIAPENYDTAIVLDSETMSIISDNTLNFWTYNHRELPENNEFSLDFTFSSWGWKGRIYIFDKNTYSLENQQLTANEQIEFDIDSSSLTWTFQNWWTLWTWNDYVFDTNQYYYIIIFENTWDLNLEYSISWNSISSWKSVYLVPVNDSGSDINFLFKYFFEWIYSKYWPLNAKYINF